MSVAAGLEVSLAMVSPNQQLVDLSSAVAEVSRSLVDFAISGLSDMSGVDAAYERLGAEFDRVRDLYPNLEDSFELWSAYLAHVAVRHVRNGYEDEELVWEQLVHHMDVVESDTGTEGLVVGFQRKLHTFRSSVDAIGLDLAKYDDFRQSVADSMREFASALEEMNSIFADLMV
jgi:hypothetical protein